MFENNENIDKTANFSLPNTYEAALSELKNVLEKVDNQEISLDDLLQYVQYANQLVQQCKSKLRAIENDVEQIL